MKWFISINQNEKKWYSYLSLCELDELNDENLQFSSCRNEYDSTWYHVVVQFIPLSSSPFSLSLIPERYLNWTQLIESDNLFIWKNLYDGKSTIQSLLLRGKKKVNDGSFKVAMMRLKVKEIDGSNCWKMKRC